MSKSLAQIVALYESHRTPQAALTPLGTATVAAHRLARALADLDSQDRAVVRDQLVAILADIDSAAWSDFGAAISN